MKHRDFLSQIDPDAVVAAIRAAEQGTTGEVRVFVSHRKTDDAVAAARKRFDRLGMAATRDRNAILIFVAPRSRAFAVLGDTGIHAKAGDAAWTALGAELGRRFQAGEFAAGLLDAVARAGGLLRAHFPGEGGPNALPDEVETD